MSDVRRQVPFSTPGLTTRSITVGGLAIAAGLAVGIGSAAQGNNYQLQARAVPAVQTQQVSLSSRVVKVPFAVTVYTDSGTGTITLSGSSSESFVQVAPVGVVRAAQRLDIRPTTRVSTPFYASATGGATFTDSGSGLVTLSGSSSESFVVVPPNFAVAQAGSSNASPVARPVQQTFQSLPPSKALGVRLVAPTAFTDSGTGSLTLSGSSSESQSAADSGSGTVTFTGSSSEAFSSTPPTFAVAAAGRSNLSLVSQAVQQAAVPATHPVSIAISGFAPVTPPSPVFPVALQGKTNTGLLNSPVPQPPPWEFKNPQPAVYVYYNAAPPIYHGIVAGGTNQSYSMPLVKAVEKEPIALGPRIIKVPVASGSTNYSDSGTGTLTLSGTSSESNTVVPPTFSVAQAGSSNRMPVARPVQQTLPVTPPSRVIVGKLTPATNCNDSGTGTITLSGSSTETQTHTASGSGSFTLTGTATQSIVYADSMSGTITLSGTATQSQTHTSSAAGTILFTGSGFEGAGPAPSIGQAGAFVVIHHYHGH